MEIRAITYLLAILMSTIEVLITVKYFALVGFNRNVQCSFIHVKFYHVDEMKVF